VVVSHLQNFLSLYFDANRSFSKVAEFGGGAAKIYEVGELKPCPEFEMRIGSATPDYFKLVREKRPDKLEYLTRVLSSEKFGLTRKEIDRIIRGEYPKFEMFKTY
jgi:hypothetical protein